MNINNPDKEVIHHAQSDKVVITLGGFQDEFIVKLPFVV